jgi:hypothetical protein
MPTGLIITKNLIFRRVEMEDDLNEQVNDLGKMFLTGHSISHLDATKKLNTKHLMVLVDILKNVFDMPIEQIERERFLGKNARVKLIEAAYRIPPVKLVPLQEEFDLLG